MKYKVGDRVRIKNIDWYNDNKNDINYVGLTIDSYNVIDFTEPMAAFCGKVITIAGIRLNFYYMLEDSGMYSWTDEMIERLVEEDKPKFKIGDKITNGKESFIVLQIASNKYIIEDNLEEYDTLYFDSQNDWGLVREKVRTINEPLFKTSNVPLEKEIEWSLPEGYVFKDENGNVINATKIVLEKKKKEYPKTYEECTKVLLDRASVRNDFGYKGELLVVLQKLLVCRDAYWKIAGEEMGWKISWAPQGTNTFGIFFDRLTGEIEKQDGYYGTNSTLEFPTSEMRDAFYENFKVLIERCKELL